MATETPVSSNGVTGQPQSASWSDPVWERAERLAAEARWLAAKCELLRDTCRTLLATAPKPFPVTPRQSELLAVPSQPPERLLETMRETMIPTGPRPVHLTDEVIESAAMVSARLVNELSGQRTELRTLYLALFEELCPSDPLTEEDVRQLMAEPIGPSIEQIVAELEREAAP